MKQIAEIKATAMNRQRARTWLEKDFLVDFGFARHAPISIEFGDDAIVVTLDSEGPRKVAGRDRAGKKQVQILDICEPAADRDKRWKGAQRVRVFAEIGRIVIKP